MTSFEVFVSKETFKFHAAHFVTFKGFRERLHGHNYKVGVRVLGSRSISSDGYVIDFGDIKDVTKRVCKELNERFLCPELSDVMEITVTPQKKDGGVSSNQDGNEGADDDSKNCQETVTLRCEDGSVFCFPRQDCAMLPIVHATAEELAIYLWSRILESLDAGFLRKRGIHTMEVTVIEAVGQEATFRLAIPESFGAKSRLDVPAFILKGEITPSPCPSAPDNKVHTATVTKDTSDCPDGCQNCQQVLSAKLQRLAEAINSKSLANQNSNVTVKDLEAAIANL